MGRQTFFYSTYFFIRCDLRRDRLITSVELRFEPNDGHDQSSLGKSNTVSWEVFQYG
jgi:hypothetical protein